MKHKYYINISFITALLLLFNACKEEEYAIPETENKLQNDVLKRSIGPNIVGQQIEFAYAVAIPKSLGKITSAQVEASIAGATGTYLENKSYYTDAGGQDVGVTVAGASTNEGPVTKVNFTSDTTAATLRYYYVIPEAARGQSVTFKFSATSSNGETVNYSMGPYTISAMDIKLGLDARDAGTAYISIADLAVYTAAEAATKPDKIDLVYLYRTTPSTFLHGFVSPAANPIYLPGITLPAGVNKSTKVIKAWNLRDRQLAVNPNLASGIYVDDLDFQQINFADAPNYALNLKAEAGMWVETADGKYRAYIFVNSIFNTATDRRARISIKRFAL